MQVIPAHRKRSAFWMREIRRLCKNGHQRAILTPRQDLPAEAIADRMFARWRQENCFKYLQAEFNLDPLSPYATEPAAAERRVPNPQRRALDKSRPAKAAQLGSALAQQAKHPPHGASPAQPEREPEAIERLETECSQLSERIKAMAKRVPLNSLQEADTIVPHERERKTLTPLIKVVAYRRESGLARMVEPFFARHDEEVRAFLKAVFRLPGDIIPDHERHELRVRLYGWANNRSPQALIALCEYLNTQQMEYPGTNLRLVYEAIQSHRI